MQRETIPVPPPRNVRLTPREAAARELRRKARALMMLAEDVENGYVSADAGHLVSKNLDWLPTGRAPESVMVERLRP